jgi:DNA invertase Pin-like site-specific DNA recombinase
MRDEVDIKHKFGYSHHVEMQEIRAKLRAEGETDQATIHFKAVAEYERRHKNDPTFAQKQASARARGEKWVPPLESDQPSLLDQYRAALEAIRDGHNDPRELARTVLETNTFKKGAHNGDEADLQTQRPR